MRFPVRDVIPSRTRPTITIGIAALSAGVLLVLYPSLVTVGLVLLHALPLTVLGETLEDQLGHGRHLGLLVVGMSAGFTWSGISGLLPAAAAAVSAAHLTLFPSSRILLTVWVQLIEIPSFFLMGCWLFTMVLLSGPLEAIATSALIGAASSRLLRRPQHARWEHFDLLS